MLAYSSQIGKSNPYLKLSCLKTQLSLLPSSLLCKRAVNYRERQRNPVMGALKGSSRQPLLLGWACLVFLLSSMRADAQKCQRSFIIASKIVKLEHCKHVGEKGGTLSWTYNAEEGSILMAYKAKPITRRGWVAWGINPSSNGLVGTQALLALRQPNGTMFTGIYNGASKAGTQQAAEFIRTDNIKVQFQSQTSVFHSGNIYIYATVLLPSNRTTVNQAWQLGPVNQGGLDSFPIADLQSFGTIDLLKGKIPTTPSPASPPAPSPSNPSPSPSPPPSPSTANPSLSPTPSIPFPPPASPSPSPSTPNPPLSPTPVPSTPPPPSSPLSPMATPPPSASPSPSPSTPSTPPPPTSPSPSPSTPNPPSSPTPTPSITSLPPFSPSPSISIIPSPSPSTSPLLSPSPSPSTSTPIITWSPFSPSPSPSPLQSSGSNNANAHTTISTISFSFISLFTAFACTMFSTM
ncbi:uncharacterized protein LOC131040910 [Cryptomeria japonica]|uniref:uncharacterized protein LOC131040910 n=1 Tax=Cryptomeria japonica TaxID=3369 RepID=UPI0027DA8375|nr:uncharacterized protein LOC131040910 [Cryptomeria japonica]